MSGVQDRMLSCSLSVDGTTSGETASASHTSPIFFPQLPLVFGRIEEEEGLEERESFIGCIADLAANGDPVGFRYRRHN